MEADCDGFDRLPASCRPPLNLGDCSGENHPGSSREFGEAHAGRTNGDSGRKTDRQPTSISRLRRPWREIRYSARGGWTALRLAAQKYRGKRNKRKREQTQLASPKHWERPRKSTSARRVTGETRQPRPIVSLKSVTDVTTGCGLRAKKLYPVFCSGGFDDCDPATLSHGMAGAFPAHQFQRCFFCDIVRCSQERSPSSRGKKGFRMHARSGRHARVSSMNFVSGEPL